MTTKKTQIKEKNNKTNITFKGQYFYGVGRRKTAVAQVRVYLNKDAEDNKNQLVVNGKKMEVYFPLVSQQNVFSEPLKSSGVDGKCAVSILVKGGGLTGQVDAIKLGIARALIKFDEELRSVLKAEGFLTRDARKVERKKPGLRKARRAPQWSKR
ncbi:MAG: 30S ribosomal protein S9 [Candidatus Moranbacteria bacterium]|nr:30S ribosomal protein S9 [Candidatus Moranbacteria bacterium]